MKSNILHVNIHDSSLLITNIPRHNITQRTGFVVNYSGCKSIFEGTFIILIRGSEGTGLLSGFIFTSLRADVEFVLAASAPLAS